MFQTRRGGWLVLAMGVWTLGGCAMKTGLGSRVSSEPQNGAIVVENNSWDRVSIFIARDQNSWHIGDVNALSRAKFSTEAVSLPPDGRDAVLIARPFAGTPFRSDAFSFTGSGTVVWTIENSTSMSHLTLR